MGASADARLIERKDRTRAAVHGYESDSCSNCGEFHLITTAVGYQCDDCGAEGETPETMHVLTLPELKFEERSTDSLEDGDRFRWHRRWYELGELGGRPMAFFLEPNEPTGIRERGGHAPPMSFVKVEVLLKT